MSMKTDLDHLWMRLILSACGLGEAEEVFWSSLKGIDSLPQVADLV